MTKQEVLKGALALNGRDKKYTVTVEGDRIMIETRYRGSRVRESTFRCIAHLRDDNTYTETNYDVDGYRRQYGYVRQKTVSYCPDGSKEGFDSEEIKKVLRDYLASCGYKKTSKKALTIALCIAIPAIAIALILAAVIILSPPEFVDTNGPDNFALTEITRDDILSKDNDYKSSMISGNHSGYHTNIVGTRLRDQDYDAISKSFGKLHGIIILQATKISSNRLTLNISSSVESGNAEIAIIVDGEYYCSVDVNQDRSVTLQSVANKEVLVKLAGEGAKIKVDINRTY